MTDIKTDVTDGQTALLAFPETQSRFPAGLNFWQGGLDFWQVGKVIKVALGTALEPTVTRDLEPSSVPC